MNTASGKTPACDYHAHVANVCLKLRLALVLVLLAVVHVGCYGADLGAPPEPTPTTPATPASTPVVAPSDCPTPAQPFVIEPQDSFEIGITIDRPSHLTAEATWDIGPAHLSLILNGPDRPELANPEAPYAREDGPGGVVVIRYDAKPQDIDRGSDWRVRVVNFENQAAAGCLKVTQEPLFVVYVTPIPIVPTTAPSLTGVYEVTYSKVSDSCGAFGEVFNDSLDVYVGEGTIAIHQRSTGADSAGTIDASGNFTTAGSGLTHLEAYEGSLQAGRIEAVNSFVQAGCSVEYSISGKRE